MYFHEYREKKKKLKSTNLTFNSILTHVCSQIERISFYIYFGSSEFKTLDLSRRFVKLKINFEIFELKFENNWKRPNLHIYVCNAEKCNLVLYCCHGRTQAYMEPNFLFPHQTLLHQELDSKFKAMEKVRSGRYGFISGLHEIVIHIQSYETNEQGYNPFYIAKEHWVVVTDLGWVCR